MGSCLQIGDDIGADALRLWAQREARRRAATRAYAIAYALEGMSRAEAARLAGMERQAIRDAVLRFNAEGFAGLWVRPKGHPPRRLTTEEEAGLRAMVVAGPDAERDGLSAWNRADLRRWLEAEYGKSYHPSSMTRVLRRLGLSRQKVGRCTPRLMSKPRTASKKGGCKRR